MSSKYPAGWAWPLNSKKAHYFAEDEHRSLCGRWLLFATDRDSEGEASLDDCAECTRRLAKRKAKEQATE